MKTHILWFAAVILAFGLGYKLPKRSHQPSVASVRQQFTDSFKQDPPKKVEVIHMAGKGTPAAKNLLGEDNYIIGIVQAGFDTDHPTYWTTDPSTPEHP